VPVDRVRAFSDFEYFAETCLKVADKQSKRLVPMRLRPAQQRLAKWMLDEYFAGRPVRLLILKARQEGVSTVMQAIFYWLCATRPDESSLTISHHERTTAHLHSISETFWINTPRDIRPQKRYSARSEEMVFANKSTDPDVLMRNPGLNSSMRTVSPKNAGAGYGVKKVHCSEVALWERLSGIDAQSTLATLFQTVPEAPETIIALESTARGVGNEFHRRWKQAERSLALGEPDFYPYFIPWFEEPEYASPGASWDMLGDLSDREERLRDAYGCGAEQILWRRTKVHSSFAGDEDGFDQEYPESADVAFLSSGRPFFDQAEVQARIDELVAAPPEPVFIGDIAEQENMVVCNPNRRGNFTVWEAPDDEEDYLVVCDPSEGSEGDPQDVAVFARSTLREVAGWHGHIDRGILGDVLYRIGRLYNTALVTVERQGGWGLTPIHVLERRGYPRIHRRVEEGKRKRKRTVRLGFDMTETNRALVLDALKWAVYEGELESPDADFYRECLVFEYGSNGKPQAQGGCHDDRVITRAIATYLWQTEPRKRHGDKRVTERRVLSTTTGY